MVITEVFSLCIRPMMMIGNECFNREREREAMSIGEMVKTLKQYYLHNMRERERERLCPYVKW